MRVCDKADRLTSITHDLASDIVHTYAYDNASRVTSFNTSGSGAAARGYGYDDAGQLISKTGATAESYAYDDNGNRVKVGGQFITTNPGNRLRDDGTYLYDYDNEGNLIKRTLKSNPNLSTEFGYNHRNQLNLVVEKNAGVVTRQIAYGYDAQGRRFRRQIDPNGFPVGGSASYTTEYFVYDGDQLSMSFDNAKNLEHRYLYGPAVDQVLVDEAFKTVSGQQVTDDVLWLLADHQGTIRDVVDDAGVLRKHVDYDSFGKITGEQFYSKSGASIPATHAEAVDQAFAFTGLVRDALTGDLFADNRVYDPSTGRWKSEDPSGLGPDSNPYRYVHNNPVTYVDPTGLSLQKPYANLPGGTKPFSNVNLAGGLSSYSTPSSLAQYNLDQASRSFYNPNPLSAGTFNFTAPSYQDIQASQLSAVLRNANQIYARADFGYRINDPVLTNPRVQSGFTVLQGVGEATVATGLLFAPEPTLTTKVGAGLLYAKAFDSLQAGARGLYYGEVVPTYTRSRVQSTAEYAGIPRAEAGFLAGLADAAPGVVGGYGVAAARNAAPRALPKLPILDNEPFYPSFQSAAFGRNQRGE